MKTTIEDSSAQLEAQLELEMSILGDPMAVRIIKEYVALMKIADRIEGAVTDNEKENIACNLNISIEALEDTKDEFSDMALTYMFLLYEVYGTNLPDIYGLHDLISDMEDMRAMDEEEG